MAALVSLFIFVGLSLLITYIATVALTLTGLSKEVARFQARSAFTGVGFTTSEAEKVVNHPVRRRILMLLMLLGNAGIVTVISSLILTFVTTAGPQDWILRLLILIGGLAILWAVAVNQRVDHYLSGLISWALQRWSKLDVRDYANLLRLVGEYRVVELQVEEDDWLANKTLADMSLRREGVIVLGIQRANGNYVGAPHGQTNIYVGDTLILYGRESLLSELDYRPDNVAGDQAHEQAMAEQEDLLREQDRQEQSESKEKEQVP